MMKDAGIFKLEMGQRIGHDGAFVAMFGQAVEKIFGIEEINRRYASVTCSTDTGAFPRRAIDAIGAAYDVPQAELDLIPKSGPTVIVANHPFGMIEGIVLADMLTKVRDDFKFMANYMLGSIAEMRDRFIMVDPFGGNDSIRANVRSMRESVDYLSAGGMLVVFPAGEVSHLDLKRGEVTDSKWSCTIARIIKKSGAQVVPLYFDGTNSPLFHIAGLVHPTLRTLMLPSQLLNKNGQTVKIRVGSPISNSKLSSFTSDIEIMEYLRMRTYLLSNKITRPTTAMFPVKWRLKQAYVAVSPAVSADVMEDEISNLSADSLYATLGGLSVYCTNANEIPNVLQEIGRLRELTFRAADEGTGKAADLDNFDQHYYHLFVWNKDSREVVGAYRLGAVDEILLNKGKKGLYCTTLFHVKDEFFGKTGSAVELGRSFIRAEYQKGFAALMLLWRGIGEFIVRRPQCRTLYGPVSIQKNYKQSSKQIIMNYLTDVSSYSEVSRLIRPRTPLKPVQVTGWSIDNASAIVGNIEDLSHLIADIEEDRKGVPVLIRQYLKLGGRFVGFNRDPKFSDVLDGLVIVELPKADLKTLERYMGKDGAMLYMLHHLEAGIDKVK